MEKAPIPHNDKERIAALKSYGILDTLHEREYDDIARLASYICKTPVSLITFVDEDRQVFKSSHGMNATFNSREYGFCAHGINSPDHFIVNDTQKDVRFQDHPMVIGEPHIAFYAGIPLIDPEGYTLGTLCVIDDKPRKLSKEQLLALKSLSNQVVKLLELRKTNQTLTDSQKRLQVFSTQMQEFAYVASHDLKEPARMVKSFMKLLEEGYANQLDENAKRYINFAVDGAERMTLLIDELLTYSRLDNLKEIREEINIKSLLDDVFLFLSGLFEEKEAVVHVGEMPSIVASRTALKIVFQNLIVNALKYRSEKVRPVINITSEDKNTHWQFAVQDNGLGISKEYHEEIFKLFKRLHAKEEFSGTGMGLASCKKIVESFGGKLWVESELNKGSTFYFTILKP